MQIASWVKELLKNLDAHLDEDTIRKILVACGEKCPFTHLPDDKLLEIKENSKDDFDFLDKLCQSWLMEKLNGQYYVAFDKCYCPLVNDDLEGASDSLCLCTLGNIERKFRIGLGREIKVETLSTVLAGDRECRFKLHL